MIAPRMTCRVCGCLCATSTQQPCTPCFTDLERERQRQRTLEWRAELQDARTEAALRFGLLPADDYAVEWE